MRYFSRSYRTAATRNYDVTEPARHGHHACVLYEDANTQKKVVLPFLKEGLEKGEHCLFVCPEDAVDDWSLELQAFGIDVAGSQETGALAIMTGEAWRQTPFTSITKAREVWEHIEDRLTTFPSARIAGDASWVLLPPAITPDRLCHWEATADLLYKGAPIRTLCLYDLHRLSPSYIMAALRTHPTVILDNGTFENPYYEAGRILEQEPELNHSEADDALIEKLLAAFEDLSDEDRAGG